MAITGILVEKSSKVWLKFLGKRLLKAVEPALTAFETYLYTVYKLNNFGFDV